MACRVGADVFRAGDCDGGDCGAENSDAEYCDGEDCGAENCDGGTAATSTMPAIVSHRALRSQSSGLARCA